MLYSVAQIWKRLANEWIGNEPVYRFLLAERRGRADTRQCVLFLQAILGLWMDLHYGYLDDVRVEYSSPHNATVPTHARVTFRS